jgi:FkbM family methyltransferase
MKAVRTIKRLARPIKPVVQPARSAWTDRSEERRIRRQIKDAPVVLEDACGVRFILYPWDRPSARFYASRVGDRHTFRAMSVLIRPGDVVFDVGAYIGIYSVIASRLCLERGKVVAFEPVPATHQRLRETIALNEVGNVVPVQQAVCDQVGTVTMNVFEPRYAVWNSLGKPLMLDGNRRIAPTGRVEVPATTLDHFCSDAGIERINFLKVDVEGFEKFVFCGAQQLLQNRRIDCICFEISQDPLKGAGVEAREVFNVLGDCGYSSYRFRWDGKGFDGPFDDSTDYWANYFASWRDLAVVSPNHSVKRGRMASRDGAERSR